MSSLNASLVSSIAADEKDEGKDKNKDKSKEKTSKKKAEPTIDLKEQKMMSSTLTDLTTWRSEVDNRINFCSEKASLMTRLDT